MKGISSVLAVVLILIVTVAIIGLAYGWASGLFEVTGEEGQEQIEQTTVTMLARIEINSHNASTLYVRNSGQGTVNNFAVFKNGIKIPEDEYEISSNTLDEGETASLNLIGGVFAYTGETNIIKIIVEQGAKAEIEATNIGNSITFKQGGLVVDTVDVSHYTDLTGLDYYVVTENTTLLPGTYYLNSSDIAFNENLNFVAGAITIGGSDITLDCNGATLIGERFHTPTGVAATVMTGIGIYIGEDNNNIKIKNCNLGNFRIGIVPHYSNFNNISNCNFFCTDDLMCGTAVTLHNADNNIVNNCEVSDYGFGIALLGSDSNIVENNVLTMCNNDGIDLEYSDNNTISGNKIIGNKYGIHMVGNLESSYNLIYNNYFSNNDYNAEEYDYNQNYWNITKTLGTNIIGGSYIGGNYWDDYTGTDTDGDELGDTYLPYNTSNENILANGDYHPLVE